MSPIRDTIRKAADWLADVGGGGASELIGRADGKPSLLLSVRLTLFQMWPSFYCGTTNCWHEEMLAAQTTCALHKRGKSSEAQPLPLYDNAEHTIREMLSKLSFGDRVPMTAIGHFTAVQYAEINLMRDGLNLHRLEHNEILFVGRHALSSRSKDGYTIDDIVAQICSALSADSVPILGPKMTCIQNPIHRSDGYGNSINDKGVFEMTARKPKAELLSVIPKGDNNKPINLKGSL
ncbi:hypothetical protein ACCS96_36425 [Rhizobium ruizarguesonis]